MDVYEAFIPENDGSVFCNADGRRASFNGEACGVTFPTCTHMESDTFMFRYPNY